MWDGAEFEAVGLLLILNHIKQLYGIGGARGL